MTAMVRGLVVVIAGFAFAGPASAVVVGNFEGGLDGFTNIGTAGLSVDGTTSTVGTSSLRVADTGTGWSQSIKVDIGTIWATEVSPGGTLSLDIKAAGGAPDVPAWWLQVIPVINSQNGGWTQLATASPVLNGQWQSFSWTYQSTVAAPGNWAELFLISNSSDIRNYNVDNVKLVGIVPEPATACVALAGLAALARSRRH